MKKDRLCFGAHRNVLELQPKTKTHHGGTNGDTEKVKTILATNEPFKSRHKGKIILAILAILAVEPALRRAEVAMFRLSFGVGRGSGFPGRFRLRLWLPGMYVPGPSG